MRASTALALEDVATHLAAIVGQEHCSLRDGAIDVAPGNPGEIVEVLRFASANELAVMPVGGGTKTEWGNPVAAQVRLHLKRINAVREHSWQDMTCTVEAGCKWAAMQAALRRHGQLVALDPLWSERATVGGVIAVNESGALRMRYGGLRDLILGMTLVLADGTIAKTGGKVVKNVAGYDLHKLMTGSYGTLAVIADVNFRLHPVEQHAEEWTVEGSTDALSAVIMRVLASTMQVSAMQLRGLHRESSDRLDIRFCGSPKCLERHREELKGMAAHLAVEAAGDHAWNARERLIDDAEERDGLVFKATMLPSQIAEAHKKLAAWRGETICVTQASGIMTAALLDRYTHADLLVESLRESLRGSGGSVVMLRLPKTLRGVIDVWGCKSEALPLMREIKKRFDPLRILNPGRFVGNI
jgi:glycolate oxidase FAD binding subunit